MFQNSIFAVGMVVCDGEGRLNEKSVLLQSRFGILLLYIKMIEFHFTYLNKLSKFLYHFQIIKNQKLNLDSVNVLYIFG